MPTLPRLLFSWNYQSPRHQLNIDNHWPHKPSSCTLSYQNCCLKPYYEETPDDICAIIGFPIVDDQISPQKTVNLIRNRSNNKQLEEINGCFLIFFYDKSSRTLSIINDRFNGFPLYWAHIENEFIASFLYGDLLQYLNNTRSYTFQTLHSFEMISMQKLLGTKTYDEHSQFLKPASVLTISDNGISQEQYWKLSFPSHKITCEKEAGEAFVSHLKKAITRQTSDMDRATQYGLLLSGGHDSRITLSGFSNKFPSCYTLSMSENYEVSIAKKVAEAVKAPHHYTALPHDYLTQYYKEMATLAGGMCSLENAQFLSIAQNISDIDVIFNGHGFDYLFQGSYMPANAVQIFGRPTFLRKPVPLNSDTVIEYFLDNLSFGISSESLMNLVKKDQTQILTDFLHESVQTTLNEGKWQCPTIEDQWEYLIVHHLGRHYSRPNIDSMMCIGQPRTPCFDNDLFDFYLSLAPSLRLNANMVRYSLQHIYPKLAKIATSNHGIPAGASPLYKTFWLIFRKLLRHSTGIQSFRPPENKDRTWPDRDQYLRNNPKYQKIIRETITSPLLRDHLTYFDWKKVEDLFSDTIDGRVKGGTKIFNSLLSISQLLENTQKSA